MLCADYNGKLKNTCFKKAERLTLDFENYLFKDIHDPPALNKRSFNTVYNHRLYTGSN